MALETIADQPRAGALLARAIETGRVSHAYAFVGPPGSGRTATALAFATALLCERGSGCGTCRGCVLAAGGRHPDLHAVVPTPPEKNPRGPRAIRIDAVREIERQAWLRPLMARRKVFVLHETERMTGEAPQAFLKMLEEPPGATHFILILPRLRAVPATVISRCQIVRFAPRPDAAAAGRRAEALALLDDVRARGAEALVRATERVDRERAEGLLDAYWLYCRDLLLAQAGAPAALLVNAERAEAIARESASWRPEAVLDALRTCREAMLGLAVNVTPRLSLEVVLSRLAPGMA